MILTYRKHCDDYHSPLTTTNVHDVQEARAVLNGHWDNGFDLTNVTLDGVPFNHTGA